MNQIKWLRIGAAAGILVIVLLVVAQFIAAAPAPKDASSTIISFYAHHRSAALRSGYLSVVSAAIEVLFATALFSVLRRDEEQPGPLAVLMLGAGIALFPVIVASSSFSVVLAWNAAHPGSTAIARALFDLSNAALIFSDLVIAVFLIAASLTNLGTRVLPSWTGWLGLLAAALLLAGTASLFNPGGSLGGAPGLLLYLIWVIATSIFMLLRARRSGESKATAQQRASAALG